MKIERRAIESLKLDANNARKHNARNLDAIKESLLRFGQQKPIVVSQDGVVRAGNGTVAAALALGWRHIDVVETTLDHTDVVAYAIADNRTGELAEWDTDALQGTLLALHDDIDLNAIGFTDADVDALFEVQCAPGHESAPENGQTLRAAKFTVVVELTDATTQHDLLVELEGRGFACRALML